jgi:nucleoside phosphorylase/tetratricopeptide (TPR) repeat protein
MSQRPSRRDDFEVAIICALPLEYDAVVLLFDEFWDKDGDKFGRAAGDFNTYTTGRIGKHDVVLALLSRMGKASSSAAAASMRSSYTALRMVILAGICGGVPFNGQAEILLGDVVISKSIIQYDFGRKYPNGFMRKNTAEDSLGRHNKDIRNLLTTFNTDRGQDKLQRRTAYYLKKLQEKGVKYKAKYRYPGTSQDKLYESSYRHRHRIHATCICNECHGRLDPVCPEALISSCDSLGCDERYLVKRKRLERKAGQAEAQKPAVYAGIIASGDTVMKSGEDRDMAAKQDGVIAFEMEGAGVWEEMPCVVVKGVCDYADCHKNKEWQNFAAATAASASKAIIEQYIKTDRGQSVKESPKGHFIVPFGRNGSFVGRRKILSELLGRIPPATNKDDCQRTVIEGLGGVGKTQIALEAVYQVHKKHPDCSIFWVPLVNAASFENAYRDIGKKLKIKGLNQGNADVKKLVKTALSEESSGSWLMVIDNADDVELLFGATELSAYLPFSRKGSILFTTRNHEIAIKLDIPTKSIIRVAEMDEGEAHSLLQKGLKENQPSDTKAIGRLLDFLANLPLAIRQASAYMAAKQISASEYLKLCKSDHGDMIDLLSKDFEDRHRYKDIQNPVATTWLISFSHILQRDSLAAKYLQFISVLAEKDIPKSLLPKAKTKRAIDAIGTLKAYAFIIQHEGKNSFHMHRLVRLAMRNWLENKGELKKCIISTIEQLEQQFPIPQHKNRDVWMEYLPHAQVILRLQKHSTDSKAKAGLLYKVAQANFMLGKYQAAELEYRRAIQLEEKLLGKDNPDTLIGINSLAYILSSQGRHEEAEQMYREVLKEREKTLGKDHPDILTSMNSLALILFNLGKHKDAMQMHQQILKQREKTLGKDHPDTLTSMSNLALVLFELGRYKRAKEMQEQVLTQREKLLGKDHPDILTSMSNLAIVFSKQGKNAEAEQMHQQVFKKRERILGKDHPSTLASMDNLAAVLFEQGRHKEAEQIYRQAFKQKEKTLGKYHPDTLNSMDNLAKTLYEQDKSKEAEKMHRQVLKQREGTLGKSHPDTLASMDSLAQTLYQQDRYKEAEQIYLQAIKLYEKVLGKGHPNTLASRYNFALVLYELGRYKEAMQMHQQILEEKEKTLGKSHPDTLASMRDLAEALYKQGKLKEAEKMRQQALQRLDKVPEKDNPSMGTLRNNLPLKEGAEQKGVKAAAQQK